MLRGRPIVDPPHHAVEPRGARAPALGRFRLAVVPADTRRTDAAARPLARKMAAVTHQLALIRPTEAARKVVVQALRGAGLHHARAELRLYSTSSTKSACPIDLRGMARCASGAG